MQITTKNFIKLLILVHFQFYCANSNDNFCPDICICENLKNDKTENGVLTCRGFPSRVPSTATYLKVKLSPPVKILTKDHLTPFKKLTHLDLKGLELNQIEDDAFSGQTQLQNLNLADNRFTRIFNHTFNECYNLLELNLKGNSIKQIEDGAFNNLQKIQKINLSGNFLTTLPSYFPQTLIELDASLNFISELPRIENSLLRLYRLNICGNSYKKFDVYNFLAPYLGYLCLGNQVEIIDMADSELSIMHSLHVTSKVISLHHLFEIFDNVANLEFLSLTDFTFTPSQPNSTLDLTNLKNLKNLKNLTLSNVNIEGNVQHISLFDIAPNLQSLDLQNSPQLVQLVFSLHDILKKVPTIKNLNLINTGIKHFTQSQANLLPNLQTLSISSNPLNCDCDLDWIIQRVNTSNLTLEYEQQTICYSPLKYRGLQLLSEQVSSTLCQQDEPDEAWTLSPGSKTNITEQAHFSDVITMKHVLYAVISLTIFVVIVLLIVLLFLCKCFGRKSERISKVTYRHRNDDVPAASRYSYEDFAAEIATNNTEVYFGCRPCSTVTFHPKNTKNKFNN